MLMSVQYRRVAGLDDCVHGVEAEPVETVTVEPVQHVLDHEGAHLANTKIDGGTPRGLRAGREKFRCVACDKIPLGAKVIVDNVEEHHQPVRVRRIDQSLEVVGAAVDLIRRERKHAVVTPVPSPEEVRDRHQLNCREPGSSDGLKFGNGRSKRPLRRKCADVKLQNGGFVPGLPRQSACCHG